MTATTHGSTALKSATRLACLMALAAAASAQGQVYRSVGPDGRVTFSDQPPAANAQATGRAGESGGNPALPFALQQAVSRYPVTLYTGNGCTPCVNGRNMLKARGIPFAEKIVSTEDDIEALRKLQGETGLPLMTIGNQQVKGFSQTEWATFLDAATYPKTSQLPGNWRYPAPVPMVAVAVAPPPPAPAAPPPLPAPTLPPSNPAGIRF